MSKYIQTLAIATVCMAAALSGCPSWPSSLQRGLPIPYAVTTSYSTPS